MNGREHWGYYLLAGVILAILVLVLRRYKPWKKMPSSPDWWKKHPWWTAATVLLVWVALANFGATITLLTWLVMTPLRGVSQGVSGTPSQAAIRVVRQEKSVGGPLLWNEEAVAKEKVALRTRLTTEEVRNGVAFVGMVPPGWVDLSISGATPGEAYLVSRNKLGFLSGHALRTHQVAEHKTRGTVFPLPGLSGSEMLHEMRYENYSGRNPGEGLKLNEMYVQVLPGGPDQLLVDRGEENRTFQYVAKIDGEGITLIIPDQGRRLIGIAPVDHPCYRSSFLDTTVPPNGLSHQEAVNAVQAADPSFRAMVKLSGEGYREDMRFQSILITRNGHTTILSESVLLQPGMGAISLRLNVPRDGTFSRFVKPAKIMVVAQKR